MSVPPVDVRRALRRGQRLYERAMRKPIGSNGRRKDLAAAAGLVRQAIDVAAEQGVKPGEIPEWALTLAYPRR